MPSARAIADWLDERLSAERYRIDEPENGLVHDAGRPVRLVASTVNTTFDSIALAKEAGADLLVVHHTTWSYIDLGLHKRKLAAVREAGLSLYCAHAALDCDEHGTGRALADLLGIVIEGRFASYAGGFAGVHGTFAGGWEGLLEVLAQRLGVQPEAHRNEPRCGRIGIVTGAGGTTTWLEEARELGCDTYLTGEGSMYTRLFARERGLNLVLAGHAATETPGIDALGRAIAGQFDLSVTAVREPYIG